MTALGILGRRVDLAQRAEAERARAALRVAGPEMADRLRSLIEHAPYCVHELDLEGRVIAMNPAGLRIMGRDAEDQVIGLSMFDVIAPPDRDAVRARFAAALRGEVNEFEFATGQGRRFASNFVPIRDENGAVRSLMGITVDVTASRTLEAELRSERDFAASLLASAPVVVVVLDKHGVVQHVNPFFEQLTGYDSASIVGRNWFEMMLPVDERYRAERVLASLVSREGGQRYVNPVVARDGRRIELEWSNSLVRGRDAADGPRIVAIGLDLSPRREAERVAADKHAQLEGLVSAALDAVVVTDSDQRVVRFNPAAERMFGRSQTQVVGQPLSMLLPARFREAHARHFSGFGIDGVSVRPMGGNRPIKGLRNGDVEFPIEASVSTFETGGQRYYAAFLRDVSERVEAERELRSAHHRTRAILDAMYAFVGLIGVDGTLIDANAAPFEVTGTRREDSIGRHFWDTFFFSHDPSSRAQIRDAVERALAGEFVRFDLSTRIGTDRVAIMDAMVKPLRDDEGKVIMVVASGIDVTAQREAAADLERTTSLLRAVIDSSPDWIFAKDREHRYLLVNRTFAAAFGREPQDMVGHRDSEFFPARLVEGDAASGRRGFHDTDEEALGGSVVRVVLEVETADGRGPRQIETVKAALRDASGAPYGTLSLSRDLTERVAMEERIRASQARLAEAQRMAKVGSWTLDLRSGELDWSDEIYRIFEVDRASFPASYQGFLEAVHPDDRMRVDAAYTESLHTRRPYDIVHRLRMRDGRVKFVHERCATEYDADGAPVRSTGTVQDITEVRLTEVELRSVAERLYLVLGSSPIVTYQLRIDGERFVPEWVSDNIARILGHAHAAAMDPDWWLGAIHPDDRAATLERFGAALEAGEGTLDYRMVRPGSDPIWVRDTFRVVNFEHDGCRRVVGVVADVTERRACAASRS